MFLRYIRPHLHVYQNILNDFPMALYVLTAYIRPFIHLSRLLKHSAQQLKEEVTHDQVAINQLNARMASVEQRVADLTALYQAAFDETDRKMRHTLESTVEPTLKGLNKDMRRTVRKEQRFMEYSVDRFRVLEQRLLEQELAIAEHRAAMDGHEWKQRNRPLLRPAYWLLDAVPSASSVVWFPISMAVRLTTWWIPKYLLPARLTNAVATNSNGPTRRASIMYSSADAFHQQVDTPTSPLPKSHHRRSGTVDDSSSGTAQNQHQHLPHRRRQSSEATFAGVVSPTNLTQPNGVRSTSSSLESMASSTTSRRVPTIMTGDVDEM